MAIRGGDGSIVLTTSVDQSGLKKGLGSVKQMGAAIGKSFLAIGAAAGVAIVAVTKKAVSAYAEYEQLVGGVETLFKGSSQKLIEYANQAYMTAGVSANKYMSIVTSFSASLLQSLGGDTDKAADVANQALIDMSDNANKMGTSMEAIQNAYQGFAKQNYTMLDNLKLGYGGTKTEMERLLKDAQVLTGTKYDINNLADVYSAIHAIQENLGITGTTAKEAEKTISGSANMMKAAWENALTAISGGGDMDRAINNLVYSIQKYFENIVPVVERVLQGVGTLIEKVAPMLVQTVAKSLIQALPSLLNAVYQMIIGLGRGIVEGTKALFTGGTVKALEEQSDRIQQSVDNQNSLTAAVEGTEKALKGTLAGFDEINTLSLESSTGDSTGGITSTGLSEASEEAKETEKTIPPIFEKIQQSIKKAFDSKPVQSFWRFAKTYGSFFADYYSGIAKDLANNFTGTFDNIKGNLRESVDNLSSLWSSFWEDASASVNKWGKPLTQNTRNLFNDIWETAIDPYIQIVSQSWKDFTGSLSSIWDEYGGPILDKIGEFANNIVLEFQSIYDNVIEPIIKPFLEELKTQWEEHIQPMIDKAMEFVAKLVDGALEIYNKFIHPIVMWIIETLEPVFTWIGNTISATFGTIIGTVSDVLGGVFEALGGLIDFIVGVFTGDWEKAWEGIKSFFTGIWDAIWGYIKGVINFIIDGLNFLWGGLYAALASIVNGVGGLAEDIGEFFGQDWGWEMPSDPPLIPKLAQGAVIPPNREFLAVLGDQKHGTNVEAPLDTIKQAVAEVIAQINTGNRGFNGRIEVPVVINGREVARAVRDAEESMGSQTVFGGFANAY